ncbi:MAG: hypothetical protein ABI675_21680 [Chitinophagaceae bacterium]
MQKYRQCLLMAYTHTLHLIVVISMPRRLTKKKPGSVVVAIDKHLLNRDAETIYFDEQMNSLH